MPATLFTKVLPSDQDYSSDQDHPSDQDYSSDQVHHQPIAVELLPQASQEPGTLLVIQQISIFSLLPSELVIEIFNHLDILTIFRFLDTCRYHRYLLLNLPDVWRRVRFIPLSEYATTSSTSSRSTPLSIAAAAAASSPRLLEEPSGALTPNSSSSRAGSTATAQFAKAHRKGPRQGVRTRGLASASGSKSEESQESTIKEGNRIKHSEDERDRDRGGSRTLISEIYAVLRRFRKENHLVDFVREIHMDSTDFPQFPSPLVMLIKFPRLEVLSSRYRRKQTSLTIDTHTLKDLLRNGDILPHSLHLRRWDIFHPYMTKEDITGFQNILDAITIVGAETHQPSASRDRKSPRVSLDIRLCPGSAVSSSDLPPVLSSISPHTNRPLHSGGGMHWASSASPSVPGFYTGAATLATSQPLVTTPTPSAMQSTPSTPSQPCGNIVWILEKCRVCNEPQERCWQCAGHCTKCHTARVPPYINHQMALERERTRKISAASSEQGPATNMSTQGQIKAARRPRTPPGSISLSQMADPLQEVRSAYYSTHGVVSSPLSALSGLLPTEGSDLSGSHSASLPLMRPPEFIFFD